MSETVHYRGKLQEILPRQTRDLQYIAKELCDELGIEENNYWKKYHNKDYIELLCDTRYNEYLTINNRLFKIESQESVDLEEEIIKVFDNEDGTFNYEVKYYNGGAGFEEVIEQAFNKLNKEV